MKQINANSKVVVIGLGKTGLCCVRYLQGLNIRPVVMDTRVKPAGADELDPSIKLITGGLDVELLKQADVIVASPGIAVATEELQTAIAAGVDIIGDIELFALAADKPVVAITGSNGKSTVTELLGKMAEAAGISVGVGGNIGLPALELLKQGHELYILELSSFQLETTYSLKPVAATILNISEDHMDRYDGMAEYIAAKLKIYDGAGHVIANSDDEQTWPHHSKADCLFGGQGDFHLSEGKHPALMCCGEHLLDVEKMAMTGRHNQMNALAALALAKAAGINLDACITTLKHYQGMAHRCEVLGNKFGITWVNDSKATNVGATVAALSGLSGDVKGRLHLIAGGDGKGADFSDLEPEFAQSVAELYCFGKDAKAIAQLKQGAHLVSDLPAAVAECLKNAQSGDWVLLSPACASLDMYANFMARGDHFRELVAQL